MKRKTVYPILSLLVAIVAVAAAPSEAAAGCLSENDACQQCARESLKDAMLRFDLSGIRSANLELWDCSIDLYHCVFFGDHHSYRCAL